MPTPSFKGQKSLQTQSSSFNTTSFHIRQELAKLNTSTLVQIVGVNVEERISPVGYVDVKPLVDQMDGNGKPVEHGIIYGVPYVRMQGGLNAFIIDPQVGDIGMCNFADRDITRVKEDKKPSLPGSKRMMSMSDGLYTGGLLNGTPERYVLIDDDGIEIEGKALVHIHATSVTVDADTVSVTAAETVDITANEVTVTAPKVNILAATLLAITSPLTTISGILDVTGNILAKAGVIVSGAITGVGGVPVNASPGLSVNGKLLDQAHVHTPGGYTVGSNPVTGTSGGLP